MVTSESTMENMRSQPRSDGNLIVAVFGSIDEAGDAIRALQEDGYDMKQLSIVGKDYHTKQGVVGYYTTGDRMMYWGKLGTFWGSSWGLLVGASPFWIPGIGQVLVAGPLVGSIVDALGEPADAGELSALSAGLSRIGTPMNRALKYETEVQNGNLLLVAHGMSHKVKQARKRLDQSCVKSTTVHVGRLAAYA